MTKVKLEIPIIKEVILMIREISQNVNSERAEKFGHDMFCGIIDGDMHSRLDAWKDWIKDINNGNLTERDGAWVPAIPL